MPKKNISTENKIININNENIENKIIISLNTKNITTKENEKLEWLLFIIFYIQMGWQG